jgi:sterol 3beta-glucosyltransferase
MKIVINTFGTRGDIQPYIALGKGLQQAGHTISIFSFKIYESFVTEHGLDFYPLDIDPRQVLLDQVIAEMGNNMIRINRWLEKNFKPVLHDVFKITLDVNRDANLILNSGLSFVAWHIAEKLNIPSIAAYLWPATPSRYISSNLGYRLPKRMPLKGTINYALTKLSNQSFFYLLRSSVNHCRKDVLNLAPLKISDYWRMDSARSTTRFVYGYSPIVLPKPPDWGENQQVSGYWFLDTAANYQPDDVLRNFLKSGPPPIYFGFGSMVEHEQEKIARMVAGALEKTGQRGILLSGWSEFDSVDLPDSVLGIEAVPHDWLFPQMAAVVHHGGAGTTAAGLRAGIPSIIVPSFGDQFFWGERVCELGVGTKPIPRKELTEDRLVEAIKQTIENNDIRRNAGNISQLLKAEDGIGNAVRMIEKFLQE